MDIAYFTGQRLGDVIRMKRADIRDGALSVTQGKTGKKMRIRIEGNLSTVIDRINARQRRAIGLSLIQDEDGQSLSYAALRSRFDAARRAAGVSFQFRNIRAKAATDIPDLGDAQRLLGHKRRAMTEHYAGRRKGELVDPVGRDIEESSRRD
jgi:integrase